MIRVCCYCNAKMGEKEPLEDKTETHGICKKCYRKVTAMIDKTKAKTKGGEKVCETKDG